MKMINMEKCPACDDIGYLEVTHKDCCEYIEACQDCCYIGNDLDVIAREQAINDGYKLDGAGKILK